MLTTVRWVSKSVETFYNEVFCDISKSSKTRVLELPERCLLHTYILCTLEYQSWDPCLANENPIQVMEVKEDEEGNAILKVPWDTLPERKKPAFFSYLEANRLTIYIIKTSSTTSVTILVICSMEGISN